MMRTQIPEPGRVQRPDALRRRSCRGRESLGGDGSRQLRRRRARESNPSPPLPRPPNAGAHPDISTSFTLQQPGCPPEAAKNVIFNAPEGVFGNPYAITHCTSSDFALDQCPAELPGRPDHGLFELPGQ